MKENSSSRLILASQSPRRKEILHQYLSDFDVIPSQSDETFDPALSLDEALMKVAEAKAEEVSQNNPGRPVLAADTIVCLDDEILGKPKDLNEARDTLKRLSGRSHEVKTGMVLIHPEKEDTVRKTVTTTLVHFRNLGIKEIEDYIQEKTCLDKAGSYGIQDVDFVDHIDGSYSNVVGLCKEELEKWIKEL